MWGPVLRIGCGWMCLHPPAHRPAAHDWPRIVLCTHCYSHASPHASLVRQTCAHMRTEPRTPRTPSGAASSGATMRVHRGPGAWLVLRVVAAVVGCPLPAAAPTPPWSPNRTSIGCACITLSCLYSLASAKPDAANEGCPCGTRPGVEQQRVQGRVRLLPPPPPAAPAPAGHQQQQPSQHHHHHHHLQQLLE